MGAPGVGHVAEECLELQALGRGALGVQHLVADHILDGTHQAHLGAQAVLQDVLDEIGSGGLAVGAGNADHGHLPRGVSIPVGTGQGKAAAGVGEQHIFPFRRRLLAQNAGSALFKRHGDIFVAVGIVAADGHKQVSRLHGAGIIGDAGDFPAQIGVYLQGLEPLENGLEFHGTSSYGMRNGEDSVNPGRCGW